MSGLNEQTIPISLPRQQWDHALALLAPLPFNEVAPLIAEIQRQCQMHEMRQRSTNPPPRLVPEGYGPIPQQEAGD